MEFIKIEKVDHVAVVTIDRPPVNAVSQQLYLEVGDAMTEVNYMKGVRTVVLRAAGKRFSVGGDVAEMAQVKKQADSDPDFDMERWQDETNAALGRAAAAIINCRYPVVAAVQGPCVGAGVIFAASSDMIVAADDCVMSIPEIKVGIIGAFGFASRIVPEKLARYMAFSGESLPIAEIAKYGNILKVVPNEDLYSTVLGVAAKIAENPPRTTQMFKHAANISSGMVDIGKTYSVELDCRKMVPDMSETLEANTAFMEKRKPVYAD